MVCECRITFDIHISAIEEVGITRRTFMQIYSNIATILCSHMITSCLTPPGSISPTMSCITFRLPSTATVRTILFKQQNTSKLEYVTAKLQCIRRFRSVSKRIRYRMINTDDDILIIKRIDRRLIQVQDIFHRSANVDSRMEISKGEQNFHLLLRVPQKGRRIIDIIGAILRV